MQRDSYSFWLAYFLLQIFRQKNIFVLAANYLQTLDWHGDAKIMKIIVQVIAHF
jgi:hypothetical protein